MEIDVVQAVGAVTRAVEDVDRDGKACKVVVATRTYPTTIEDLWDAVTSLERIPRWFLPITGDLKVGGRYQFEGNAGGEILSCEPPHRFEVTWEFADQLSWLAIELRACADGASTELELRHTAAPDEFWEQFGPGAVGLGWDGALIGLDLHVERGAAVDRAEAQAWMGSANYREFMTAASAGWRDASLAAGTDPAAAEAAWERVTEAYTATPE
ncbi:MAG: SRPBCC family protein [Actinobacteria bacterium]|nr:SRPBCC family protein [Actinomycetota bacterium]